MNSITIITNKYPNRFDPHIVMFVQQFAWAMADQGLSCNVICPMAVPLNPRYLLLPPQEIEYTKQGNMVTVHFPRYMGFGQTDILGWNPARISTNSFTKAANVVLQKLPVKPDVLYGHFVTPAGIATARLGASNGIPSFMGFGEYDLSTIEHFGGVDKVAKELKYLTGVIAVSQKNKDLLVDSHVIPSAKVEVFPNGYRNDRFMKKDRKAARKKFGFPEDAFIAGFVGSFDERKGILRLVEAASRLEDVHLICAGKGSLMPSGRVCLHNQPVHHSDLPDFLNAADVFALPTLNEGLSNAIVEAIACGLPIISADLPFNDEILDETNSLRINPTDVDALSEALKILRDDVGLRARLAAGSLERAKGLTLDVRARNILTYMREMSSKEARHE